MITLLLSLPVGIFWIWGVNCLLSDGYILGGVGRVLRKKLPEMLSKPLFDCPPCMSSIHGTIIFLLTVPPPWYYVFLYIISLAGANYIIKEYLYPEQE